MPRRRFSEPASFAEAWAALKADYNMAKSSRFRRDRTGVSGVGRSGDYHLRNESQYLRMMELARAMDRDDCIIGQTVDRAVTNLVQDGITIDARTGDPELDKEINARRKEYCEEPELCDLSGELTQYELTELAARHMLIDGDILGLPTRDGPIELVEGHRIRTPTNTTRNVVCGVLLERFRRRLQYWITKNDIGLSQTVSRVSEIKKYDTRVWVDDEVTPPGWQRQIFHVYNPKRVSLTRGVTALHPIVDLLAHFEDINFAKMVQAQVVSCFAIFRMRENQWQGSPQTGGQRGERTTETLSDGSARTIEGYAPGMEFKGDPGEKLLGFSPQVPNAEFFPHVRLLLQLIGVNLGLPLVLVLLDASETNFSGWRGAVDQARLGFRRNQRGLANRFIRPDHKRKIRQWMDADPAMRAAAKKSGINIYGHRVQYPSWPYIEPLKDAQADLLRTRNALASRSRVAAERNIDWDDEQLAIIRDNAGFIRLAHEQAEKLNKELPGLNVTWRDVACLPTPDGVKIALPAGSEESRERN